MKKWVVDYCFYIGMRCLIAVLSRLPHRLALAIGGLSGVIVFYVTRRRRNAYADLKAAFGSEFNAKERWKIVRDHFSHLGKNAVEILRFPQLDKAFIEKNIFIDHPERFFNLVQENQGIVLLTAHFGNWELLQIVSGILEKPIHVLARKQKYPKLDQLLNRLRESHGSIAVRRGMRVRDLIRALERKDLIGVLGDQDAGKRDGLILSVLGRKTTIPTGSFELAERTGAPILPCFIARQKGAKHRIYVGEPIRFAKSKSKNLRDFTPYVQSYIRHLEQFVREYPSQWLWAVKRWKYTWTKRLLILSDGKPGHVKQSEALASYLQSIQTQYDRPGMEYRTERVEVEFRSPWSKKVFPWFAFFFIPFAQGRLGWLRFFFKTHTFQTIINASADFVISAGSSLIPLNLCLARESHGKSLVLMKPSFPFNFFRYDLAVIPHHDQGKMPKETFRTYVAPSRFDPEEQRLAVARLRMELRAPDRVGVSLFLGGSTKQYRMDLADVEKVIATLERVARDQGDYLITTSRRTPDAICRFLKQKQQMMTGCQQLVIASEDNRSDIVPGMMAVAETLIVSSDSVSMISEAVSSGKRVIVLKLGSPGPSDKHDKFQAALADQSAILIADVHNLEETMQRVRTQTCPESVIEEEKEALCRRLQEIL